MTNTRKTEAGLICTFLRNRVFCFLSFFFTVICLKKIRVRRMVLFYSSCKSKYCYSVQAAIRSFLFGQSVYGFLIIITFPFKLVGWSGSPYRLSKIWHFVELSKWSNLEGDSKEIQLPVSSGSRKFLAKIELSKWTSVQNVAVKPQTTQLHGYWFITHV